MHWQRVDQLLNEKLGEANGQEKHLLRDCILKVKVFQNLRLQMGGDDQTFDECFKNLKYEFAEKNSILMYPSQKIDWYYFILEGNCGIYTSKADDQVQYECKLSSKIAELNQELKKIENKLLETKDLQGEEEHSLFIKCNVIKDSISKLETQYQQCKKESDQNRIKEGLNMIDDKKLRNNLTNKFFISQQQICSIQKTKTLISGDTIDEINLGSREYKNTIITQEDTHLLKISTINYTKVFAHIITQINHCQRILRSYFQGINEESIQQLSYEFRTIDYQRNEVIYHQNSKNLNLFFILIDGVIEIRKYYGKSHLILAGAKQFQSKENDKIVNDNENDDNYQENYYDNEYNQKQFEVKIVGTQNNNIINNQEKIFSAQDNYHSIMIFSGMQVFGMECNEKINQYQAVSISTETKVLVMNRSKFEQFYDQINFRSFLKKQAAVQNKYFSERLDQLTNFQQKYNEEKEQLRQFLVVLPKTVNQAKCENDQSPSNDNSTKYPSPSPNNNHQIVQYLHKTKVNDKLLERSPISLHLDANNTSRKVNLLDKSAIESEEKNQLLEQKKEKVKGEQRNWNQYLESYFLKKRNSQEINKRGDQSSLEKLNIQRKSIKNLPLISENLDEGLQQMIKQMEFPKLNIQLKSENFGSNEFDKLDFELDCDKIRRNNILLEHKVSKNLKQHKLKPLNQLKENSIDCKMEAYYNNSAKNSFKDLNLLKQQQKNYCLLSKQEEAQYGYSQKQNQEQQNLFELPKQQQQAQQQIKLLDNHQQKQQQQIGDVGCKQGTSSQKFIEQSSNLLEYSISSRQQNPYFSQKQINQQLTKKMVYHKQLSLNLEQSSLFETDQDHIQTNKSIVESSHFHLQQSKSKNKQQNEDILQSIDSHLPITDTQNYYTTSCAHLYPPSTNNLPLSSRASSIQKQQVPQQFEQLKQESSKNIKLSEDKQKCYLNFNNKNTNSESSKQLTTLNDRQTNQSSTNIQLNSSQDHLLIQRDNSKFINQESIQINKSAFENKYKINIIKQQDTRNRSFTQKQNLPASNFSINQQIRLRQVEFNIETKQLEQSTKKDNYQQKNRTNENEFKIINTEGNQLNELEQYKKQRILIQSISQRSNYQPQLHSQDKHKIKNDDSLIKQIEKRSYPIHSFRIQKSPLSRDLTSKSPNQISKQINTKYIA